MMYALTQERLSIRGCECEYKRMIFVSSYNKANNSVIVDDSLPGISGEAINPPSAPSGAENSSAPCIRMTGDDSSLVATKNQDSINLMTESSNVDCSANGRAIRVTRNVAVRLRPVHSNLNDRVEQGRFASGLINHLRIMASSPHGKCVEVIVQANPLSPDFPTMTPGKRKSMISTMMFLHG